MSKEIQIFKDKKLQSEFDDKGYVVIPFISLEETKIMRDYFYEVIPQPVVGLQSGYSLKLPAEKNKSISDKIEQTYDNAFQKNFINFKYLGGNYMVKSSSPDFAHGIHQDWQLVDENKYYSFAIWCALKDVSKNDGSMVVIEKSHNFFNNLRSESCGMPYFDFIEEFDPCITNIELKEGEALIYNNALFHGSFPNVSGEIRLATVCSLLPEGIPFLYHHYDEATDSINVYEYLDYDDFLAESIAVERNKEEPQKGKFLKSIKLQGINSKDITAEMVIQKYFQVQNETYDLLPLFKDESLEKAWQEDGYVVIPFIDDKEQGELQKIFDNNYQSKIEGLFPSVSVSDFETRKKVSKSIQQVFSAPYQNNFENGEYFFGHFMVKSPEKSDVFHLHQDWGIVNEKRFPNAQIWCPLVDTGPDNGGMFVIKGSHRFFGNVRSGSVGIPFLNDDERLKEHITDIHVPKGHALIYNNALFHGSYPNSSNELRIAAFANVYHSEAELVYHQLAKEKYTLDQFRIDKDFFLENLTDLENGVRPPEERFLRKIKYFALPTSKIDVTTLLHKVDPFLKSLSENRDPLLPGKFHTEFPSILPVFKSKEHQAFFEENGYLVVPFYNKEEIDELMNLYQKLHPKDEKGFFPSTFSRNKEYRITADKEIRRIGSRSIEAICENIKVVCGSYIVKSPGEESVMGIHQDMTLVDESKYLGINIWCPLVDLTETNGALYVLPGSHRLEPTLRHSSLPNLYDNVMEEVKQYGRPLYLKAGEAVIFDQSIIHYSPPNLSDAIRPVTNTYFTHKDAVFQICYWEESYGKKVEIFEQDDNFMTDFDQFGDNIFARPKIGKSLGLIEYDFPYLTPDDLHNKYGNGGNNRDVEVPSKSKPKSFISRVLDMLKSSNL